MEFCLKVEISPSQSLLEMLRDLLDVLRPRPVGFGAPLIAEAPSVSEASEPSPLSVVSEEKAASPPTRPIVWTVPRKDYILREYPRGTSIDVMEAALQKLPGAPFSRAGIAVMAAQLGVKRPDGPRNSPARAVRVAPTTPTQDAPVAVNYEQMTRWAVDHGISEHRLYRIDRDEALRIVNAKRKAIGSSPFQLASSRPEEKA